MDEQRDLSPAQSMADPNADARLMNDDTTNSSVHAAGAHSASDETQTEPKPSTTSASLQDLSDRALHFISTASNETLGACLVGLGASTYLVLGRVGLVLIGVVGGVVLHATWEGGPGEADKADAQEKERKKRELGLEVASRVLRWRNEKGTDGEDSEKNDHSLALIAGKKLDYSAFQPETAAALGIFTDAVIGDYVKWWYTPILPGEETFPSACRQTLTAFLISMSNHLSRKRPVDAFLDFITNSSSIVIVFLNELAAALNASPNTDAADAIVTYLEMKPDSSLANVLDSKHQDRKLDMVADDILQSYLDPKAYNYGVVRIFLKEVLSKLILAMTIQTCSKPEWINGMIVNMFEGEEPELIHAIDAGVESSTDDNLEGIQKRDKTQSLQENPSAAQDVDRSAMHQRHASRAEEVMDEAMKEAQRLTEMIKEEEARKERERHAAASSSEDVSEDTTQGTATPTSSQSDLEKAQDADASSITAGLSGSATLENTVVPPTTPPARQSFTSFDQLVPNQGPTALQSSPERTRRESAAPVLTLYNAKISIFDDSMPGEKGTIKAKPTIDYLIQIEPSNSNFPGWMIARKYADFETLHEVLRRISVITGVGFNEGHAALPTWKMHTKASLRGELERYLMDAVQFQQLAESEGMKRFLEKDQGLSRSPSSNKGFGWPTPSAFDTLGKNMMDVLTKAPKQVAGGGQSFFGGVNNVLGGGRKNSLNPTTPNRSSMAVQPQLIDDSYMGGIGIGRESQESVRSLPTSVKQTPSRPSSVRQNSFGMGEDFKPRPSVSSSRLSVQERPSSDLSRSASITAPEIPPPPSQAVQETFHLPPPPSEITDDYGTPKHTRNQSKLNGNAALAPGGATPARLSTDSNNETPPQMPPRPTVNPEKPSTKAKPKPPITEQETSVAIELLFAVITELYTLSSAWNIRRTLLNAAKTFLLRPGNPQLEAIRVLIQESVIDANTSDAGLAAQILKVRENALPTEEELKKWPEPLNEEQKEELRIKARRLLVEKGMPQALTSVMGAAASGEALGKVFDCLQVGSVSKGLVFGLMLQGLRTIVQ